MRTPEVDGALVVGVLARAQLQIRTEPLEVVVVRLHKEVETQVVNADANLAPRWFDKERPVIVIESMAQPLYLAEGGLRFRRYLQNAMLPPHLR